jgi:histidyl-tRNA synthetase
MKAIQSVRGMKDTFGNEARLFQTILRVIDVLFSRYQLELIVLPIIEKTELFSRGIGNATDVVEKEMYTFQDRNEDSLTLRPEGTAGCVRACLENGLIHNQIRKFWYVGPMFRHERPQKGRYRQFYQVGVEIFGLSTSDIEAETLLMLQQLWTDLGIARHVKLEINTIGTLFERQAYRQKLFDYLIQHQDQLDEDSQRRLHTNPLRIWDSKVASTQAILQNAPQLIECIGEDSMRHFDNLQHYLSSLNIQYEINPKLVRGLDYYCHTVFEWTTDLLGAQATVCGGGRYDGLVAELGGQASPAFGFAMGLERLVLLAEQVASTTVSYAPLLYLLVAEGQEADALTLAQSLRQQGLDLLMNFGGGSVKSQFKRAEKSGARFALAMTGSCYEISFLTEARSKESIAPPDLKAWLQAWSVRS